MKQSLAALAVTSVVLLAGVSSAAACPRPQPGQIDGRIIIPKIQVNIRYVEGTENDAAVPGRYPVHYRSTNLPGEGQTIVISGHHFTHRVPGTDGGAFRHTDRLKRGDVVFITRAHRFGGGTVRFVVSSNQTVYCGHTQVGFYDCPAALRLMRNFTQTKVYLITCIGDGYARRIVTAFAERKKA